LISLLTQGGSALLVMLAAPWLVRLFGVEEVGLAVTFVSVFGVTVLARSISRTLRASLQAAGDTTWPFYGTTVGSVLRLGLALLALPSGLVVLSVGGLTVAPGIGLGVAAVFAAILADFYSRMLVTGYRYRSGAWKVVARRSPVGQAGD
jgi:Na+-driven multidrug efflux pump